MKVVNTHEDHTASCICCKGLVIRYEDDWSNETPGVGTECVCTAGCFVAFDPVSGNGIGTNFHVVMQIGRTCSEFEPREGEKEEDF